MQVSPHITPPHWLGCHGWGVMARLLQVQLSAWSGPTRFWAAMQRAIMPVEVPCPLEVINIPTMLVFVSRSWNSGVNHGDVDDLGQTSVSRLRAVLQKHQTGGIHHPSIIILVMRWHPGLGADRLFSFQSHCAGITYG